ncbi:MAG: cation:proton antiporter [Actinobacteria bacterium]|nr:cation:proton antiporter [Actinomycetota bacterium]
MLIAIEAPSGAALEFVLLFAVVLLGPVIVERAGIPGIIGLLLGGFAIGPHGIGWVEAGNRTIPELGQLGLLYLMFVAGLELDMAVLRAHKREALTFGVLTFAIPFGGGVLVGASQHWALPASLLLGSLLASHTLILYPAVRDAGLGGNPAVASAVGATVLTDTLALVVLAGVAGSESGSGSTTSVLVEVAIGLAVLGLGSIFVLPRVARLALGMWGGDRAARFLVAVVSFLVMAVVAEVFGIEGIVGAFFAGIALNPLVPNESPSMERLDFFGNAVFIPVFLVSVGLLLDPSVMFTASTMGLAGLICVACLGGKAIAAFVGVPLLRFTPSEAGVIFVLTTPQAAATLAATLVGYDIGLFSTSLVNAVLVLILVSIVVSTLLSGPTTRRVPVPEAGASAIGEHVMLACTPDGPSVLARWVAERLSGPDVGIVEVVVVHEEGQRPVSHAELEALERDVFRGGLDGSIRPVVDVTVAAAVAHAVATSSPSAVVVDGLAGPADGDWSALERLAAGTPVLLVGGPGDGRPRGVELVQEGATELLDQVVVQELATRLGRRHSRSRTGASGGADPGQVAVVATSTWPMSGEDDTAGGETTIRAIVPASSLVGGVADGAGGR